MIGVQRHGFAGNDRDAILSPMVKPKPDDFGRYQIYPNSELTKWIERQHDIYPARISASALICIMLEDYRKMVSKK